MIEKSKEKEDLKTWRKTENSNFRRRLKNLRLEKKTGKRTERGSSKEKRRN